MKKNKVLQYIADDYNMSVQEVKEILLDSFKSAILIDSFPDKEFRGIITNEGILYTGNANSINFNELLLDMIYNEVIDIKDNSDYLQTIQKWTHSNSFLAIHSSSKYPNIVFVAEDYYKHDNIKINLKHFESLLNNKNLHLIKESKKIESPEQEAIAAKIYNEHFNIKNIKDEKVEKAKIKIVEEKQNSLVPKSKIIENSKDNNIEERMASLSSQYVEQIENIKTNFFKEFAKTEEYNKVLMEEISIARADLENLKEVIVEILNNVLNQEKVERVSETKEPTRRIITFNRDENGKIAGAELTEERK